MKISVKNLGILEHSEIDLSKKLNILCGANNTGKTYMAYTIFGWHHFFSLFPFSVFPEIRLYYPYIKLVDGVYCINFLNIIKDTIKDLEKEFSEQIKPNLSFLFNLEEKQFAKTEISFINIYETFFRTYLNSFIESGDERVRILKKEEEEYLKILGDINDVLGQDHYQLLSLLDRTFKIFINSILKTNVLIFPAERAAINIFSKELSIKRNDLVDELLSVKNTKNRDKLLEERATRYPLPIRESLKIAEDLARLSQQKSKYEYLAEEIEKKILKGKIKVNKYGEIQYTPNGTKNVNLPMHVSASMVKSLSSIVFYFRHLAQAGDLIIIDEPELNLHPDMQRAVARLLARFVNEGFKVLISTHSDYIIKELNLLIMLNNPDKPEAKELQKKYGYQDNELLKPEDLGVYLFKDKHSEVVPVTQEGFEIETIDKEINELNHAFKNIYFSLYD